MNENDLRRQIEALTARIQRLERHLQLPADDPTAAPITPAPQPGQSADPLRPIPATVGPPTSPPPVVAPPVVRGPAPPTTPPVAPTAAPPTTPTARHRPPRPPATPPLSPVSAATSVPSRSAPTDRSIESAIGIKVLGGIGAIVVVIGAAFAAREYGADLWLRLPASVQTLMIAGFGVLLLLGGEIALRKLGRPASLGLYGAGLGVLYMDAFATFQWFEIVSRDASFLLMGLVAACGFAITLRTRFLSIGVLSLIGGYLAPILLWTDSGGAVQLMAFLTMLAGIALALSAWRPRPFRPLRYVAFGFQCFLGLIAAVTHAPAVPIVILVFISIWWTMFMAEAVFAAVRRQSPAGNVIISLLGTAAYVTCATWILYYLTTVGSEYLGGFTAMIALLCGAVAMHFGPGLDGLRGRLAPGNAMDKLAVALWAQMGVLITVAIALQFDGFGISVGWLALALASIEIGRRLPSAGTSVFGLIVLGLGVLHVAAIDQFSAALETIAWSAADLRIDRWTILGLLAVLAVHAAAKRIGGRGKSLQQTMPVVLAVFGAIGWLLLVARQADGLTLTSLWLAGAVVLLALEQWNRRERHLEISLLMLLVAAAKWLLFDALAPRLDPGWNAAALTPLLNAQMGLALAIAGAGWWGLRRLDTRAAIREQWGPGIAWQIAAIIGGVFLLIGLSFEVDRAVVALARADEAVAWAEGHMRQLFLTLLWAFGSAAFGLLAMMFMRRSGDGATSAPILLRFAWGVLAACAIKWFVLDTLAYALALDRSWILGFAPIGNVQMLAAAALAMIAMFLLYISGKSRLSDEAGAWQPLRAVASIGACAVVLWGLTFEIDRFIGRLALDPETVFVWPDAQLRAVWWSVLWAAGGLLMMPLGRWRGVRELSAAGLVFALLAGAFWIVFGALMWRVEAPPVAAPVILNLHFLTGVLVLALLAASLRLARDMTFSADHSTVMTAATLALMAVLGFFIGTFEIDRGWAANPMAKQMGWSIYWALYGAMLVLVGFVRLSAASRYVGLALLFITIVKVLAFDMQNVDQVWRILSFIVSGLLLIGTSMAYAKLSPKLLATLASRAQPSV